jgi:hypothetical protein
MTIFPGRNAIMAGTEMETTSAPTDELALQRVESYSPLPASQSLLGSPWAAARIPRERRLWTAALAAALLVTAGGLGVLYVDDANNQAAMRSLDTQIQALTGRSQNLQDQLKITQGKLTASQSQVDSLSVELQHPTLGVWNVPMTLHNSTEFLSATVPDTFTYHLKLKSSGPMSVSILSTSQFRDAILCVYNGRGTTNYCMHYSGSTKGWLGVTSVNEDFNLATGCAAYLAVITAASQVTVTPDVSVTYNPAAAATGSCA